MNKSKIRGLVAILAVISFVFVANAREVAKMDLTKNFKTDKVNLVKIAADTYEWSLPDGKTQKLHLDLKSQNIDPSEYDEFRFDIKPLGSQVALSTKIEGFPKLFLVRSNLTSPSSFWEIS